jgi:FKBP-type peptidyl-prolyl cis-trans isomerase FkpA
MNNKHWAVTIVTAWLLAGCAKETPMPSPAAPDAPAPVKQLQKIDVVKGTGEGISAGQQAVVHYTGWLYDPAASDHKGKQFDSSRPNGKPFRFVIGAGRVIKGWDEGVQGMQPGGQRQLVIPSDLAYGPEGAGGGLIPPNATLMFDVELLAIEEAPAP